MQVVEALTANGCCAVRVRAHALPRPLAALLEDSADILRPTLTRGDPATSHAATTSTQSTLPHSNGHDEASQKRAAIPVGRDDDIDHYNSQTQHTSSEGSSPPAESSAAQNGEGPTPHGASGSASEALLHDGGPCADGSQTSGSSEAGHGSLADACANGDAAGDWQHDDGADEIRRRSHGDATASSAPHHGHGEARPPSQPVSVCATPLLATCLTVPWRAIQCKTLASITPGLAMSYIFDCKGFPHFVQPP